jgi:hypothetical protein
MSNREDEQNTPTQPLPVRDTWDDIITPPPGMLLEPRRERRPGSSCALRMTVALCLGLSLVSLALSAVLAYGLLNARQTAVEGLDAAIAAVDGLGRQGWHYDYHFEQTIPVSATIPIRQDLVFPFKGALPIKTTVKVPVDAGVLGSFVVEVPIDTTVNVDTSVPIHVDQTFQVNTTIPVNMTVPINVSGGDPRVQQLISQVRDWLVRMRNSFY